MSDPAKQIAAKFAPQHRYANFGAVIRAMRVCGFRGIPDLTIGFDSPVCALSGLNGAGKSTMAQLAVCAYKSPSTSRRYRRFYVADFFPVTVADPTPFSADARVEYSYETNQPDTPQVVTVSRKAREWSGYKRQPEGYCFYVGFTLYIPKVERRDLSIYRGTAAELRGERPLSPEVRATVSGILNQPYADLLFQAVGHKDKQIELGLAVRNGHRYSENNMGFGEGRVFYMVDLMETAPEQSLFVLEEPETSLHEEAQYRLARYLLDVCNRRHHQIILSTHSSVMLDALPAESRKLLLRDEKGVTEFSGISSTRARAVLSGGRQRALTVCVEDDFSKLVLTEIVRRADATLLKAVAIEPLGNKDAVKNGIRLLDQLRLKAVGVRDGDVGADPANRLFSLPGSRPPETEVFEHAAVVSKLRATYGIDLPGLLAANPDLDHHEIPKLVATDLALLQDALSTDAVQAYVGALDPADFADLIAAIRAAV